MSTQNEIAEWILEQIPGSRIIKRPKKVITPAGEPTRWSGRIADEKGDLHTVDVIDSEPRTMTTTPYAGFSAE